MEICEDIKYVGVDDHIIDLFEGQYKVENGMAYNSYVILDNKIAIVDSVDANFGDLWINNVKSVLGEKEPEYLIIHHAEPDHSASIQKLLNAYKNCKIVASLKAFEILKNFYGDDFENNRVVVKENDELELGAHTLKFVSAPMVHWPEVMMSYDKTSGVLFSADAFGKFGALDIDDEWACEARRYYFGIVGKFGVQVQMLIKKLSALTIKTICPLHGPVLRDDLNYYLELYNTWSSYSVESEGVFIAYTSVYGNTKKAANILAEKLEENGVKVVLTDLARADIAEAVEDAFRYGKIVLATTTYNGDVFPIMREFINELISHNYQNRKIALIENGSWSATAAIKMKALLEPCKNLDFVENVIKINSSVSSENIVEIENLAKELANK